MSIFSFDDIQQYY